LPALDASLNQSRKMNLDQYLPVFLFILIGLTVGVAPQIIGFVLGPNRPDPAKNSPYECGFEAFGDARMQFDVRYYLIAILFILFDLETALLFPWAATLKELGLYGFLVGSGDCDDSDDRICLHVDQGCPGLGVMQ
jgi:NADH-quinone oxidoreductase subunit A